MRWIWSATLAVAVSAVASAQSDRAQSGMMKDEKMAMAMTYTGCIESVNHGAEFLLTHVADGHDSMMHSDAMMKKDHDMAKKDASQDTNAMPQDRSMNSERMMAPTFALTGRSDLKKHIGHKVTVTGTVTHATAGTTSNERDRLAVSSLKVVAKSCS